MGNCCSCCLKSESSQYEPLLQENEREMVSELLYYLQKPQTDFYNGDPLQCLISLAYSHHKELQQSSAMAFAEITERDVKPVTRQVIDPILHLLKVSDQSIQRAAASALGNLAIHGANKQLIVSMGALDVLGPLINTKNIDIQCNVVGCLTNLATLEQNKSMIASSGLLAKLIKVCKSKDHRVQRNATGALLNMTHSPENRIGLLNHNIVPILVNLLSHADAEVQYYSTTTISNLAVDEMGRQRMKSEKKLVKGLIKLVEHPKVQIQAILALRNLGSDAWYQYEIVAQNGLTVLYPLLIDIEPPFIPHFLKSRSLAVCACLRNLSIHNENEKKMLEFDHGELVKKITQLITIKVNDEVSEELVGHCISIVRNLGVAEFIHVGMKVMPTSPQSLQCEILEGLAVLCLNDDLKPLIVPYLDQLVSYLVSNQLEICMNCCALFGNLFTKMNLIPKRFVEMNWQNIVKSLHRLLQQDSVVSKHIALWLILQLTELDTKRIKKEFYQVLMGIQVEDEEVLMILKSVKEKMK